MPVDPRLAAMRQQVGQGDPRLSRMKMALEQTARGQGPGGREEEKDPQREAFQRAIEQMDLNALDKFLVSAGGHASSFLDKVGLEGLLGERAHTKPVEGLGAAGFAGQMFAEAPLYIAGGAAARGLTGVSKAARAAKAAGQAYKAPLGRLVAAEGLMGAGYGAAMHPEDRLGGAGQEALLFGAFPAAGRGISKVAGKGMEAFDRATRLSALKSISPKSLMQAERRAARPLAGMQKPVQHALAREELAREGRLAGRGTTAQVREVHERLGGRLAESNYKLREQHQSLVNTLREGEMKGVVPPGTGDMMERELRGTTAFGGMSDEQLRNLKKNIEERIASGQPIDPREYVNYSKVIADPSGEQILKEEVERFTRLTSEEMAGEWDKSVMGIVMETGGDWKKPVTFEQTKKAMSRLGLKPEEISEIKAERLNAAEIGALTNLVNSRFNHIKWVEEQLANNTALTDAEREALEGVIPTLRGQIRNWTEKVMRARSAKGRDLSLLRMEAFNNMTPSYWFQRARRVLSESEQPLTDEIIDEISGIIRRGDHDALAKYIAGLREWSFPERAAYAWKAFLLTKPSTHLVNFFSTATMGALEVARKPAELLLDMAISTITGVRTSGASMRSLGATWQGFKEGVPEAWSIFMGRGENQALRRYDVTNQVQLKNNVLDWIVKRIYGALGGVDAAFKKAAYKRGLMEQAVLRGRRQGLKGSELSAFVDDFVKNEKWSNEMVMRAFHDAEVAVFQNKGALGGAVQSFKRHLHSKSKWLGAGSEVVMPFTMTPANVATRTVEYSGLGTLGGAYQVAELRQLAKRGASEGVLSDLQKRAVDKMSRGATGLLAGVLVGYQFAKNGQMSTNYPSRQRERALWRLTGQQENAIKIGGRWLSLEGLSPFGNLLVFGAYLHDLGDDLEKRQMDIPMKGLSLGLQIANTVKEQSFLMGLQDILDATDVENYSAVGQWGKNLAGSIVPNIVAGVAQTADPIVRDPQNALQAVAARVPGLSRTVQPKLNAFGEPIKRDRSLGEPLWDPLRSRSVRTEGDPLLQALNRAQTAPTVQRMEEGETNQEFFDRRVRAGQELKQQLQSLVNTDYFKTDIDRLAQRLSERGGPEYKGKDPDKIAEILRKEELENLMRDVRSSQTRMRKLGYR